MPKTLAHRSPTDDRSPSEPPRPFFRVVISEHRMVSAATYEDAVERARNGGGARLHGTEVHVLHCEDYPAEG
jgi:hypothetical protein